MTDDELNEIEARVNAATPGPWTGRSFDESQRLILSEPYDGGKRSLIAIVGVGRLIPDGEANAAFIAQARADMPALIAELRAIRKAHADAWAQTQATIRATP